MYFRALLLLSTIRYYYCYETAYVGESAAGPFGTVLPTCDHLRSSLVLGCLPELVSLLIVIAGQLVVLTHNFGVDQEYLTFMLYGRSYRIPWG